MSEDATRKYKTLARDTGLFTISSFGSKILVFLLTPLYTSILATQDYGIADLITTTINFIYPILTLAIADATLRFALDKSINKNAVFCVSTVFTAISVVVLCFCKPLITLIDSSLGQYWYVFIINFTLFNVHNYFSNFVKAIGKTSLFAIQGLVHTATIICCNIVFLVILKLNLDGYLLSTIIGYIVPIILMFFGAKLYKYITPFSIDIDLLKEMLVYSIPMIPTLLAWSINTSIDKYMIIWMHGLSASGVYSVAHKIPTIITTILTVFTQAWQISVISNHGSEDESLFYTSVYKGLDFISLTGCMFVILICKQIAKILFARDFFAAWQYVPMLVISAMFSAHSGFLAAAYRAAKKTKSLFISVMVGSVINIILNYILIRNIGVLGAAIATAISFLTVWVVRIILIQRIVKVDIYIPSTIICYSSLFLSAYLVMMDVPYSKIIVGVLYVVICILHRSTIIALCKGCRKILNSRKAIK